MAFKSKATNDQILEAYKTHGNIWKAADQLGMCGQSVHERLHKLGAISSNRWTPQEDALLAQMYDAAGKNKGFLDEAAAMFKRLKSNVCRRAKELKLTDPNRQPNKSQRIEIGKHTKMRISLNGHPKGMLGKSHSEKTKSVLAESSKKIAALRTETQWGLIREKSNNTRKRNGTRSCNTENAFSRTISGKRPDLNQFFRSRTEANYARFLNHTGIEWVYEPKTFFFNEIKRGAISYTPDFYCPSTDKWYEVKGWMDTPSQTRLKRFKKYYPLEAAKTVIISQSKATYLKAVSLGYEVVRYEDIEKKYSNLPHWE